VQPLSDPSQPSGGRPVDPSWSRTAVRLGGNVVAVIAAPTEAPAGRASRTAVVGGKSCSCGHGKHAHEHYRRGSDCALCACGKFRRSVMARLTGR
jgi:hypothetical protein